MPEKAHAETIDRLVRRLFRFGHEYTVIHREWNYSFTDKGKVINGEIDLYAIYRKRILIFEVKSGLKNKHRFIAYNQLNRAERYFRQALGKHYKIAKFYVSPNTVERYLGTVGK